jgi:formylglycine-generating enzyme required for sulfatase activity
MRNSWNKIQEFITALNAQEKTSQYRLPSEAEWEYAARAGTTTSYSFPNDSSQLSKYANFCDSKCINSFKDDNQNDQYAYTAPVKSYSPNAWGLYDMHGNVWEWCQDWYGSYPTNSVTDPVGATSGSNRVIRGGDWYDIASYCRSASRDYYSPGDTVSSVGFRLACRLAPQDSDSK